MKGLADYIHDRGLKAGIYSSPGPTTCGKCAGSWLHEAQDARTFAEWGYDFIKYDWCSYSQVVGGEVPNPHGVPIRKGSKDDAYATYPFKVMGEHLRAQKRDIVFSLCQYGGNDVWKWGSSVGGSARISPPPTRSLAAGPIRICSSSVGSAGVARARHPSARTSNTRTSASGACSPLLCSSVAT